LNFQKVSSGSVRFGSTEFLKCRFEPTKIVKERCTLAF
jgi:hypothetical protein